MIRRRYQSLLAAAALAMFWCLAAHAQVDSGMLVGAVRDPSGGVIVKAAVTATEVNTNIKVRIESDADGNYSSPPLKVGTYTLVAEKTGFQSQTRPNVTLQVQDRIRKVFQIRERYKVEFRAEFFNAFNHPNFAQPDNFIDDGPGSTGVITSLATPMRQVQFGLKLAF